MIEIKLNFAAEQTDHIVSIFQPSAAPHLSFFFPFELSVHSRIAQSKAAFLFAVNLFEDEVILFK